jgi:hypothetical protein
MAGVTHVEGDVTANFTISPLQGAGVVYHGTYREHATGNFFMLEWSELPPGTRSRGFLAIYRPMSDHTSATHTRAG